MKRGESMRSRGYTLIEIAGVMVVLGLLLGASLLPLNRQLRESEYRQERVNMERLRDAVLGYALRHRTPGVGITMVDDVRRTTQTGFYASHPYLPCVDLDNDGIEDRRDLISPILLTLTRSFLNATPREDLSDQRQVLLDMGVSIEEVFRRLPSGRGFPGIGFPEIDEVPIVYSGACFTSKGQLPWRTLGSIPADYWGNRYTYFSDPVFSQQAIGFDEKTIADAGLRFLPRVLTTLGVPIPQKRNNDTTVNTPGGGRTLFGQSSVICDIAKAAGSDINCGRDGTVAAPATLIAGEIAPTDGDGVFFTRNDIADGLPFVIVSHGHNGFGAYNHLLIRQGISECRDFEEATPQERVNLYVFIPTISDPLSDSGIAVNACNIGEDGDRFDLPDIRFDALLGADAGYFFAHRSDVSAARAASSLSDRKGMDDLLVWMTRGDLARRMSEAQVFPFNSGRPPVLVEPE